MSKDFYEKDEEYFTVAVFWPNDCPSGYGIPDKFKTLTEAQEAAKRMVKLGYGEPERNPIHIRHIKRFDKIVETVLMPPEEVAKKKAEREAIRARQSKKRSLPK